MTDVPGRGKRPREFDDPEARVIKKMKINIERVITFLSSITEKDERFHSNRDIYVDFLQKLPSDDLRMARLFTSFVRKGEVTLLGAIFWDYKFWYNKISKDFPLWVKWVDKYIEYRDILEKNMEKDKSINIKRNLKVNIDRLRKQPKGSPLPDIAKLYFWFSYFYDFMKNRFFFIPETIRVPILLANGQIDIWESTFYSKRQIGSPPYGQTSVRIEHKSPTRVTLKYTTVISKVRDETRLQLKDIINSGDDIVVQGTQLVYKLGSVDFNKSEDLLLALSFRYNMMMIRSVDANSKKMNVKKKQVVSAFQDGQDKLMFSFNNYKQHSADSPLQLDDYLKLLSQLNPQTQGDNKDNENTKGPWDMERVKKSQQIPLFTFKMKSNKRILPLYDFAKLDIDPIPGTGISKINFTITQDFDKIILKMKKWKKIPTRFYEAFIEELEDKFEFTPKTGQGATARRMIENRSFILMFFFFGPNWDWSEKDGNPKIELDTLFEERTERKLTITQKFDFIDEILSEQVIGQTENIKLTSNIKSPLVCGNCLRSNHPDDANIILRMCGGCSSIYYCSTECQKQHWDKYHCHACK